MEGSTLWVTIKVLMPKARIKSMTKNVEGMGKNKTFHILLWIQNVWCRYPYEIMIKVEWSSKSKNLIWGRNNDDNNGNNLTMVIRRIVSRTGNIRMQETLGAKYYWCERMEQLALLGKKP